MRSSCWTTVVFSFAKMVQGPTRESARESLRERKSARARERERQTLCACVSACSNDSAVSVCFCEVEGLCVFCVNTPGFTFAKVVLCACDSVCKCVCARTRMRAWVVLSKLIK